mgnify:CR=1 FL=1
MINIFDMMGPVMVGPSSSHTAGAARIGNMGRTLLGEEVARADIGLYGSFAETGYGQDRKGPRHGPRAFGGTSRHEAGRPAHPERL